MVDHNCRHIAPFWSYLQERSHCMLWGRILWFVVCALFGFVFGFYAGFWRRFSGVFGFVLAVFVLPWFFGLWFPRLIQLCFLDLSNRLLACLHGINSIPLIFACPCFFPIDICLLSARLECCERRTLQKNKNAHRAVFAKQRLTFFHSILVKI